MLVRLSALSTGRLYPQEILLTGHNTLRRHLHLLRLIDTPLCRGCGAKEETLAHILCECEALASLTHTHTHIWAPFFWNQRILKVWA